MKSRLFIFLLLLIFPVPLVAAGTEDQLKESVTAFWQATQARDRVTSMKYVYPDDLNNFLNKNAAVIKSWEIDTISMNADSTEAQVKMKYSMETYPGIAFNLAKTETWQLFNNEWKIRVHDPSVAMKEALLGNHAPRGGKVSQEKILKIMPDRIKFYKANPNQPAFIRIENYLDIPATLELIEVDQDLIEIAEKPSIVNPGEKARIKLQYIGKEKEKENLSTQVVLEIKSGENITRRTLSVVYNYMNAAMKWLQKQHQPETSPHQP